jgi:hypothetical protein
MKRQTHFDCYCGVRRFTEEILLTRPDRQVDLVLVDLMVDGAGKAEKLRLK